MQQLLSLLPKIDQILQAPQLSHCNKGLLKKLAQQYLQHLREQILTHQLHSIPPYKDLLQTLKEQYHHITSPSLIPLINATGVVLQTNLGRSVFSQNIIAKIAQNLSEYSNLEYDITQGKRGERYEHIKAIICALFDCEDALVLNNNAAALMLIINTFAKNKEVIISRGELVEIGGSFRIPEVIKESGGILHEVGATNKTHLKDYEEAINEESAMIIKVHQSNFAQIGFTQSIDYKELQKLAQQYHLIDYYDVGSGYIKGIKCNEPSLLEIAKNHPSLVSFSGDKLLGGTQAGIVFGKKALIEKLKKNHLLRALRIDKISLMFLQETLLAYLKDELSLIPTLSMLNQTPKELLQKAQILQAQLQRHCNLQTQIIPTSSKAGGGSLPLLDFPSYGISLQVSHAQDFCATLRQKGLISRIHQDKILLDMRCIQERHFDKIVEILKETLKSPTAI